MVARRAADTGAAPPPSAHIFVTYQSITNRIIYIDDLTALDKTMAVLAVLLVLDATRRVIGWALPITAMLFLGYALFGTNIKLQVLMEQLYLSTEGIFGSTLGVSASYVIVFVLFGSFMEKSGTGKLFMDFALSITGHTAGGPGKVAVVSSSLFGTISGSAVANVMVDGPMTIPLMKRTGFSPAFAAGVEATASTGGQIMPPIMGAAAFVMAEYLAVSYFQVTLWAWIPALLFYLAVFAAVHFDAKRVGLMGLPRAELPRSRHGAGRARPPVHPDPDRAGRPDRCRTRRRCARWSARCLPADRAAAPVDARRHRLAHRARRAARRRQGRAGGGHGLRLRRHRHRRHLAHRAGHQRSRRWSSACRRTACCWR